MESSGFRLHLVLFTKARVAELEFLSAFEVGGRPRPENSVLLILSYKGGRGG